MVGVGVVRAAVGAGGEHGGARRRADEEKRRQEEARDHRVYRSAAWILSFKVFADSEDGSILRSSSVSASAAL